MGMLTNSKRMNTNASSTVRGRLAPSPTGYLHLGNAWSFLLCWLAVRSEGGQMVLRMEDIDPERSRPEFVDAIMRDLAWLGLDWDEGTDVGGQHGPYTQSERLERYAEVIDFLADRGHVYPCYCTRKELKSMASAPHAEDTGPIYSGTCRDLDSGERQVREAQGRKASLRLHGDGNIAFIDLVQGPVRFDWNECGGDFPLRRSDGIISYQLAVAVDDLDQKISLVVRGQDILPSTPRQITLFRMLGGTVPSYAHVPLVLDHRGERLAKRHRSLELRALRESGVAARAIVGWLAYRAGLLPDLVPASPHELVRAFSWRNLTKWCVVLDQDLEGRLMDIS
jgi:glutamyl-tRNA synthetase